MRMPLEQWQQHLEGHFSALAASRATSAFPVFALEHGLTNDDLEDIFSQLRERVATGLRFAPYWLLWTIYAAERGYSYVGSEYWTSFEDDTPGWEHKDRYKLSGWFAKFQRTYHGVVPTGPWAEQFRIIAWPITHAVLPRYLQRHFARALYDLRFRLAGMASIEPAAIGRMIAANYHGSSRFEEFLQQDELVGCIVLALLHREPLEGEEPLLPSTLERIASDLEHVRNAREWLREASSVTTDRFKGIGHGSGQRPFPDGREAVTGHQGQDQQPDIRPDLLLRYAGNNTWTLLVEVPSFKTVAAISADVRNFLKRTRCSLNGSEDKKPAGWLLSGNRKAVLKRWPDADKALLSFEKHNGAIEHLLASTCRMTAGPVWLFRIGSDGLGREIRSGTVRPGHLYVLVSSDPIAGLGGEMHSCAIDCDGVYAVRLIVPQDVGIEYEQWLKRQGLALARTIRVWPAGLPGRNWDGEGRSDWLTTERPCIGITADHSVDSYAVNLDQKTSTVISADKGGRPTFIQLPLLEAGVHLLTIKARRSSSPSDRANASLQEGYAELRVREPEPWLPGTASHAGLIVSTDPHDAGLDVFWENRFALSVLGPAHRHVSATVILEDSQGNQIFHAQLGGPLELPITPQQWRKHFADFLRREQCEWRHLEAAAGILTINGAELGEYSIRFEHEAHPLRWILRQIKDHLVLRLIDDTGQEDAELKCRIFKMEAPVNVLRPDVSRLLSGAEVSAPGGLYIAQCGKYHDLVVVSTGLTGTGFEGLGVTPDYREVSDDPRTLVRMLHILRYWQRARLSGFLADARRQQVIDGLLLAIFAALCGAPWARLESHYLSSPNPNRALDDLQAGIGQKGGFGSVLRRDGATIPKNMAAIVAWYTDLARRYRVCREPALCAFAIGLAGQPTRTVHRQREELQELISEVKKYPVLLRGARLLALASANPDGQTGSILPRWEE